MTALSDQIAETKQLLSALHVKQKGRKVTHRTKQKFSRVEKKRKSGNVRALPLILTRSAVITLLLVSIAIVIAGIEYFTDREAIAKINGAQDKQAAKLEAPVSTTVNGDLDDKQLLDLLSKQ